MPVIGTEFDRREHDADVERVERLGDNVPAQRSTISAHCRPATEHRFMCIEHFLGRLEWLHRSSFAFLCPDTNPDSHALDCQFAKGSFLKVLNDTGAREPLW